MMRYTIGWESNGKKGPILWEKYEYQFPRVSPHHEFCCIFSYCGKCMGEPMNFPYAEVYHRMEIGWEKSTHAMGKVWLSISQTFPIPRVLSHFSILWEIYGKPMHFPYAEVYHKMGIWWKKSSHTMGKVWVSVFQTFPMPWLLLHFLVLWEIYGETHTFPICWSIP